MLSAGASAFLLKNATEQEIQKAIKSVVKGENYFSKEFLFLARNFITNQQKKSNVSLSDREKEILAFICQGYSNQEIADAINLSIHTVDTHRRNLLNKTGAKNTASLVMTAFRDGLMDINS
jgi:DNA-binding NarL/FixJ family response regulator